MTNAALRGKPDVGNPHVWFDEGEVASCTEEASLRRVPCRRQPEGRFTRLVGRFAHLGEAEARTVAIEVGMQNGGMAGALAVGVLGSAVAALPANVFSIWMNFSGSVLASFWSRRNT